MKRQHGVGLVLAAMGALLTAVAGWATPAQGQVMRQIPADALVVIRVNHLEQTAKKFADWAHATGIDALKEDLKDPLALMKKKSGMDQGLDVKGDEALVLLDFGPGMPDSLDGVALVPITDYATFLGNFKDVKTTGAISEIHIKEGGATTFVAQWGSYAAISANKDRLTPPAQAIAVADDVAKDLDAGDLSIYVNMTALSAKVMPDFVAARAQALMQMDAVLAAQPNLAKWQPVADLALNEAFDVAHEGLQQTQSVTITATISADGIGSTVKAHFAPGQSIANALSQMKNTDGPLLEGLPDAKYVFYGGSIISPDLNKNVLSKWLDPIEQEIAKVGPDGKSAIDWLETQRTELTSQTGYRVGMLAPTGQLGVTALLQTVEIEEGDAKALNDCSKKRAEALQELMKLMPPQQQASHTVITPDAKTIEGVSFDKYQTQLNVDPDSPAARRWAMGMQFAYGPEGQTSYLGQVDGQRLLQVSGLTEKTIGAAVIAIKGNDAPLANNAGLKLVAAQLPTRRVAAYYLSLDAAANSAMSFAQQILPGAPNLAIPDDLPPIGMTVAVEPNTLRFDSFIPSPVVQAGVSAALQFQLNGFGGGGPKGL